MGIRFENIIFLAALPAALGLAVLFGARRRGESGIKRAIYTSVRCLGIILICLSLAGMNIMSKPKTIATMFAADFSESSIAGMDEAFRLFSQAAVNKPADEDEGLLAFGDGFTVVSHPSDKPVDWSARPEVSGGATDIESALRGASGIDGVRRIVLISDGIENAGSAMKFAAEAAAAGIAVDVYPVKSGFGGEVQVSGVSIPERVGRGSEFDISVAVDSSVSQSAELKLYKGGRLVVNEEVSVVKGRNNFVFKDRADGSGGLIYRAVIEPQSDTRDENNAASAYSYIGDTPSILIIEKDGSGAGLRNLLAAAGAEVSSASPEAAPQTPAQLGVYSGIVLADINAGLLPAGFMDSITEYVQGMGGGLMATGGENSFALGGYTGTVLEELLPVSMNMKTEGETPDLAIALLIDRSGSMAERDFGISRMELAKEATARSVDNLTPEDYIGVIAFDTLPEWAVPLQRTEDIQKIKGLIAGVQPGGGTSILPAVIEGAEKLRTVDTKLKHIILLTDGQAEQNGYDSVIEAMRADGITLSTVAVGAASDTALLTRLAEQGGGRYYYSDVFSDLPEIFAKETMLAGKEYIKNREFTPVAGDESPILSGIERAPSLRGYIGSSIKPLADAVLLSDEDEPVLATMKKGLGRTAAWTSDVNGTLSGVWLTTEEGAQTLRNAVSWIMRRQDGREVSVSAAQRGGQTEITLKTPPDSKISGVMASVLAENGEKTDVSLSAAAPGEYRAVLPEADTGAYVLNAEFKLTDGSVENASTGFAINYPAEYDIRSVSDGASLLARIAAQTGGRVIESADDVYKTQAAPIKSETSVANALLWAALAVLLADIALRRFTFIADRLESAALRLAEGLRGRAAAEVRPAESAKGREAPERQEDKGGRTTQEAASTAERLLQMKKKRGS